MQTLGRGYTYWPLLINASAYHHPVAACNFVKVGQVGLVLVGLFVGAVEDIGVIVNTTADKDIGNELQEWRLSNTSLSNKKDGVQHSNLVLQCSNDPFLRDSTSLGNMIKTHTSSILLEPTW